MFGAGRITRCRTDSLVFFTNGFFYSKFFIRSISPEFFSNPYMHQLGESFGQAVGKDFNHD